MVYDDYQAKKIAGAISIEKLNDAYAASVKQWDPSTGQEIAPSVEAFSLLDLQSAKDSLTAQIADIDSLITDATNLP